MVVDVHKVITNFFNVEMNDFIAKHYEKKPITTKKTGGLMDVVDYEYDPFYPFAVWLNDFRDAVYKNSPHFYQEKESLKKNLEPLLDFHVRIMHMISIGSFEEISTKDIEELSKNIKNFFDKMDVYLREKYFSNRILDIQSHIPVLIIRVKNNLGEPLANGMIEFDEVLFPQAVGSSKLAFVKRDVTNQNGTYRIRLMPGSYLVKIQNYGIAMPINLYANSEIEMEVIMPLITVKINDNLGFPVENEEVIIQKSDSKEKITNKTDENGLVKMYIAPGSYVINIPKYRRMSSFNAKKSNINVRMQVIDIKNSFRGIKKMLGLEKKA